MDAQALSTQRLLELTKTETARDIQRALIRELVSRGAATIITPTDDPQSIRNKVVAVTPTGSIPQQWLE